MHSNQPEPTEKLNWETFQRLLPDYIQREIKGQDADAAFPLVALMVETSPKHEEAYYLEYRRQVMTAPIEELSTLGNAPAPWDMVPAVPNPYEITDSDDLLVPKVMEKITLWFERGMEVCRGLEFDMPTFATGPTPALDSSGMMSDDKNDSIPNQKSVHITPEGAPVELSLEVRDSQQPEYCILEVAVELEGRFGDYSGVTVILEWGEQLREAITDPQGQVRFPQLPRAELPLMRVRVILPDDE